MCRESHPLCRFKNPSQIYIWLFVDFYPATRSVKVYLPIMLRQYIETKRSHASLAVIDVNCVI